VGVNSSDASAIRPTPRGPNRQEEGSPFRNRLLDSTFTTIVLEYVRNPNHLKNANRPNSSALASLKARAAPRFRHSTDRSVVLVAVPIKIEANGTR